MTSPGARLALVAALLWALASNPAAGKRKQPPAPLVVVQALKPTGLRISVLDEEGMDLVVINANINKPLEPKETGQISQTVVRSRDGFWTLQDSNQQLKPDDAIFYWVYVSGGQGRQDSVGHHVVSEFVDPSCKPSVTTVNGRAMCKGALVFEDSFETLNNKTWRHNIEIWNTFFNAFVNDEEHSFAKDGVLHIKPTAVTDESQLTVPLKLQGCTAQSGGENCERTSFAWNIPPPARSAWITSTSSFKFVRLEFRAKPAAGDWLYTGIYLYPRESAYGGGFNNGEIVVWRGRGNANLIHEDGKNYGANYFKVQVAGSTCNRYLFDVGEKNLTDGLFSGDFHTYVVTWTPREVKFEVDGEVFKRVAPPRPDGFLGLKEFRDCDHSLWEKGSFMAPLDKEFTLDISLNIGGFYEFPDGIKSGKHAKPWRNKTPRAILDFWRARDEWLPTWKDLEIDYVRMWAV